MIYGFIKSLGLQLYQPCLLGQLWVLGLMDLGMSRELDVAHSVADLFWAESMVYTKYVNWIGHSTSGLMRNMNGLKKISVTILPKIP